MARPRKPKDELHDWPVTVRLTDELLEFYEAEARIRDVPRAIIMREHLVEKYKAVKSERYQKFKKTG